MATAKGIVSFTGKAGNYTFYLLNGKPVVRSIPKRKKGKAKALAHVKMKKERLEFTAASETSKLIRKALCEVSNLMGPYVSGRLTALLLKICRSATGEKGKLPLLIGKYKNLAEGFELNEKLLLRNCIERPDKITVAIRPKEIILKSEALKAKPAGGATHYRVAAAFVLLSDLHYNDASNKYLPEITGSHGYAVAERTVAFEITKENSSFELRLPLKKRPKGYSLIVLLGIEYCHLIKGEYEAIKGKGAMRVMKVM